jgi:hypothetical protein
MIRKKSYRYLEYCNYPKILFTKYLKKKILKSTKIDNYNIQDTYKIFFESFSDSFKTNNNIIDFKVIEDMLYSESFKLDEAFFANLLSVNYWLGNEKIN